MALPEPLTPPDLDLRGFTYMPLEVVRLRDSDLVVLASGDEFRAAVLLWCAAWHQVPAASLPKDERMLANLAGFGRDLKGWRAVSEAALRGFIECTDGRLYHPVIAEKAIESGSKKRKQGARTEAATEAARLARIRRDAERDAERNGVRDGERDRREYDTNDERNGNQGKGKEEIGEESNGIESKTRESFDGFWKAYPRRDSDEQQDRALEEFCAVVKTGVDPKVITFGAMAYCAKVRKQNTYATRYVKQAWRWLGEQDFAGPGAPTAAPDAPFEPAEKDWRSAVKRWILNESHWPRWAGNDPRSPTCRCPPEILAECGVCPNTARRIEATWWFAEFDTPELAANLSFAAEHNLKIRLYKFTVDGVEKDGAHFMKRIPPGYDDATGGKLPPTDDEAAA